MLFVGGRSRGRCRMSGQLEPRGYEIERATRLPPGLDATAFDVVIFAPTRGQDEETLAHCSHLRLLAGPVLIVLQQGADSDFAVRALDAGADDCLSAPHNPREVVARIRALLRRRMRSARRHSGRHCVFDGHHLDSINLTIRAPDGREVEITRAQHRLLVALLARPGEVVSREHLLAQVLGEGSEAFDRAIDVHVSRLKKRLAQVTDAELISAYRGVGYRLDVQRVTQ